MPLIYDSNKGRLLNWAAKRPITSARTLGHKRTIVDALPTPVPLSRYSSADGSSCAWGYGGFIKRPRRPFIDSKAVIHQYLIRSSTMYYSSGNYEAFARPLKPDGIDTKHAWIVGSGLAGLSTAAFLLRDAQMPGENITILEESHLPGGALDGLDIPEKGFVIRGGREMESHFECLWDLFRSVPSIEEQGASILDEFYWLNKRDPNISLQRATERQGQDADTGTLFTLSDKSQKEMIKLFLATRKDVEDKRIDQVFSGDFFKSIFGYTGRQCSPFRRGTPR